MLKINYIQFKNFRSYPNKFTKFDFSNNKLTIIKGRNGSGKTTVLYAILYALYGKVGKLKQNEFINDINERDMLVELEFEKNGSQYLIKRGQSGNKKIFEIHKNGVPIPQSSSRDYQKYLEEDLVGISYNLFLKLIMINSSIFDKNFITLTAGERRAFLEEILSMDILSTITKHIKEDIKIMKSQKVDLEHEISLMKNNIENNKKLINQNKNFINSNKVDDKEIETLEKQIKNFKEHNINSIQKSNDQYLKKQAVIKNLESQINRFKPLNDLKKELDEYKDTLSKIEKNIMWFKKFRSQYKSIKTRLNEIDREQLKIKNSLLDLENKKRFIDQYSVCKGCENLSKIVKNIKSNDDFDKLIIEVDKTFKELNDKNNQLNKEKEEKLKQFKMMDERFSKENEINNKKIRIENSIKNIMTQIEIYDKLDKEHKEFKKMKYVNIDKFIKENEEHKSRLNQLKHLKEKKANIEKFRKELIKLDESIKKLDKEIKNSEKKLKETIKKIESYERIKNVCENENVKEKIFSQYIPTFNRFVNKYLSEFNIPFKLTLDKLFNFKFTKRGKEVSYSTFSKGEEVRVNLAIILSFIKIIETRNVFKMNLLAFDEIDGVLDSENLNQVIFLLSKLKDRKILFITHRNDINPPEMTNFEQMNIFKDKFTRIQYV